MFLLYAADLFRPIVCNYNSTLTTLTFVELVLFERSQSKEVGTHQRWCRVNAFKPTSAEYWQGRGALVHFSSMIASGFSDSVRCVVTRCIISATHLDSDLSMKIHILKTVSTAATLFDLHRLQSSHTANQGLSYLSWLPRSFWYSASIPRWWTAALRYWDLAKSHRLSTPVEIGSDGSTPIWVNLICKEPLDLHDFIWHKQLE